MKIKIPVIPIKPTFTGAQKTPDYRAICIFAATGFFLDQDTYYAEQKSLLPAHEYLFDSPTGAVVSAQPYFQWHYSPIERSLKQIVQEFATIFETIIREQVGKRNVILPLSGGLDSRTQAAALYHLGIPVHSYGYAFEGGHDETYYGKKIAKVCDFPFEDWKVQNGYLWSNIQKIAKINGCYSEFTHPRQMAFTESYAALGDVFSLGHWGDVMFDDMGISEDFPEDQMVSLLIKKLVKKGGMELAKALWNSWELEGHFEEYFQERIQRLLDGIPITNSANAKIRAFKSLYWAPRWTSINLSVFESVRPITVPYYDTRMCEFICTVPEKYLTGRQIQIEYLKMRMPDLAKITWQDHRPFNLYHYQWDRRPWNLPYKIVDKIWRTFKTQPLIQRNWELQFLGETNEMELKKWLFENPSFAKMIPAAISERFYHLFKTENAVYYSHSVSMLLTLSLWTQTQTLCQSEK